MAYQLVKGEIANVKADVVVSLAPPAEIYLGECGKELYRFAGLDSSEQDKLENLAPGEFAAAPAIASRSMYVFYMAELADKAQNIFERKAKKCYMQSMKRAAELGCGSIAFPLLLPVKIVEEIKTGADREEWFGRTGDRFINVFLEAVYAYEEFAEQDMEVYLVLENESIYWMAQGAASEMWHDLTYGSESKSAEEYFERLTDPDYKEPEWDWDAVSDEMLIDIDMSVGQTWQQYLLWYIDANGYKDPEIYKRAGVSKQTFSKIRKDTYYHPEKNTVIAFILALQMKQKEAEIFLAKAGYVLSDCDRSDVVVRWFIEHGRYDIYELNHTLDDYGLDMISIVRE